MTATLRRFGAIGDIHAEDVRLAATLAHFRELAVDAVLSVGDVVDGPGDVDRCVTLLRAAGVITVRGNHDRWIVKHGVLSATDRRKLGWSAQEDLSAANLAWVQQLPATLTLSTSRGSLLLCHGIGDDDMVRFMPPSHDDELAELARAHALIVAGHVHERFVHRVNERCTMINAGTLSSRGLPGFVVVDLEGDGARAQWFNVDADGDVSEAEAWPIA